MVVAAELEGYRMQTLHEDMTNQTYLGDGRMGKSDLGAGPQNRTIVTEGKDPE
jgi:hypothetical protein